MADNEAVRRTCSGGLENLSCDFLERLEDLAPAFRLGIFVGLTSPGSRSSLASGMCASVTRMTLETMRRRTSLCSISDAIDSRYVMLRVGSSAGRPAEGDGIVTRRIGGKPKKSQGAGICDRSAIISDVSSCLDACN